VFNAKIFRKVKNVSPYKFIYW